MNSELIESACYGLYIRYGTLRTDENAASDTQQEAAKCKTGKRSRITLLTFLPITSILRNV